MRKLIVGLVILLLLLVVVGCGTSGKLVQSDVTSGQVAVPSAPGYGSSRGSLGTVPPATTTAPDIRFSSVDTSTSFSIDRMVVRTGNIELVVSDVAGALDNIIKIAGDFGGYVVTSQKWKEGERTVGTISIRILAENYDKTITALRALAIDVINETTSSQDVTEEYSDLGAKVKNLEATEAQLVKIMQTATKTEDVLSIQRELTNVRGQIEQAKGRMQYLERTTATSLINIKLSGAMLNLKFSANKVMVNAGEKITFTSEVAGGFAPYNYRWDFGDGTTGIDKSPAHSYKDPGLYTVTFKVTDDKGYTNTMVREGYINVAGTWNPAAIARGAWSGFTAFGRVFVDILIWLGIFSPVWIIIGAIVWFTAFRKRKKAS